MTPLVLISGFLGAGKTSLLRALLPRLRDRGVRPQVILNDYVNARVDAATLEEFSALVHPIAGTCICCGSQDELMWALRQAPHTPETVMLLEANGTADTTEVIELLTADRRARRYTLPVQVAVTDAARWQRRDGNNRLERLQARTAGYHVLTRLDEVTSERRTEVERTLLGLAPGSRVVDAEMLSEALADLRASTHTLPERRFRRRTASIDAGADDGAAAGDQRHDHISTHHFASLEIPIPEPMESTRFRALLEGLPADVVRVKGIARLVGIDDPVYFERTDTATSVAFTPIRRARGLDCVAILIGGALDDGSLRDAFDAVQGRTSREV